MSKKSIPWGENRLLSTFALEIYIKLYMTWTRPKRQPPPFFRILHAFLEFYWFGKIFLATVGPVFDFLEFFPLRKNFFAKKFAKKIREKNSRKKIREKKFAKKIRDKIRYPWFRPSMDQKVHNFFSGFFAFFCIYKYYI